MRKIDELEQPTSCLNKSRPDELVFVLCARDPLAASAVEFWANNAEQTGLHSEGKIAEARACARMMRVWRITNSDKVAESRGPYGGFGQMPDHEAMEAIRRKEERRSYKMSAAVVAGTTILGALVRENEGETLTDLQLKNAALSAGKFAEFLASVMIDVDGA